MTDYWFDANFFIPADGFQHYLTTLKQVINHFWKQKEKYTLKITKRVRNEVRAFDNIIKIYFKTETVEDTPEFTQFIQETKYALGLSKAKKEPADQSLLYAAIQTRTKCYIITNDDGFFRVKRRRTILMENVDVLEPTDFLKKIMLETDDESFIQDIKRLLFRYAEHFIQYRLNTDRSIERILESLLIIKTDGAFTSEEGKQHEASMKSGLSLEEKTLISKCISGNTLDSRESEYLEGLKSILNPFILYRRSINGEDHDNITRTLYITFPELINKIKELSKQAGEKILNKSNEIIFFLKNEIFNIRVSETLNHAKNCQFNEAIFHFSSILESDWGFALGIEIFSKVKFLYGIFLLNIQHHDYFTYLYEHDYWKEFSEINELFKLLIFISKEDYANAVKTLNINDLSLLHNLGLYYCNTNNKLGLKIFKTIFKLELSVLKDLEWHDELMKRFLLELRIRQENLNEEMRSKLLNFLEERDLEENTSSKFDSNSELNDFTPIENSKLLFRKVFFLINFKENNKNFKINCWNNNIRSVIHVKMPKTSVNHLENVKSFRIKSGTIRTKRMPRGSKIKARIMVILKDDCILEFERFKMDIQFEQIKTDIQLKDQKLLNLIYSGSLSAPSELKSIEDQEELYWKNIITKGESKFVEFKSTLRWDVRQNKLNKNLQDVIAKEVCAFLNTEGGQIFIGVEDDGAIFGLEKDFSTLKKNNSDGFLLTLDQVLNSRLGKQFNQFLTFEIISLDEKFVCVIEISKSKKPVFFNKGEKEDFYIRGSAGKHPMGLKETIEYIKLHW